MSMLTEIKVDTIRIQRGHFQREGRCITHFWCFGGSVRQAQEVMDNRGTLPYQWHCEACGESGPISITRSHGGGAVSITIKAGT
jgi:hypothetical protein